MADTSEMPALRMTPLPRALLAALVLVVAGCAEREVILPGEREAVRPGAEVTENRAPPLRLPESRVNAEWTHLNGAATHLAPAVALAANPARRWSVEIGAGSGRRERLIAAPVVADGRVYTLDAAANVTAVSTAGQVLWQASLAPAAERPTEGFGGGLAARDGVLVVATGFGEALRLDPRTGAVIWRAELEGTVRAAPTLGEDKVIVVARNDLAYGIDIETGEAEWRVEGAGLGAGLLGGASPAVRGPVAVLPFLSGEVRAVLVRNGLTVWTEAVTGGRRDLVRSRITDITGDPVIDFDIVYVANQSGRIVALDRRSGDRLWTQKDGSYGPALPVGGSVFVVSDIAEVLRLDASDGSVIWRRKLPEWVRPDRRRMAIPHYGPLLAGGRLIVASGDGVVRSFDPVSGALLAQIPLSAGAAAQPAIAGGVLYVLTTDGRLSAFQ